MKQALCLAVGAAWALGGAAALAGVKVESGFDVLGAGFAFQAVPLPANNDAATDARFTVVDGARDRNGGGLEALHDGRVPSKEDQPAENFFFQAGSAGGRIRIDLGRVVSVKQVCSYSWHNGARGPQVYALYAADGRAAGFNAEPTRGVDPAGSGWQLLARVDTRPRDGTAGGGQHGVAVSDDSGTLGAFRYLLLDVSPTETNSPFGNTFYSEIDVADAAGPALTSGVVPVKAVLRRFETPDKKYAFAVDQTEAPDLAAWVEAELEPVVLTWYPRLAALLASDGYQPPAAVALRFRGDMGGTPASAGGGGVNLNAAWFRNELKREALGSVVHELVHVVQGYGRATASQPRPAPVPGWVVEGIADYVRWFLYEPQSRGAEITRRNLDKATYDGSYRISANFLDWAVSTHDKELVRKLNAAAREGRYAESLWKTWTGKRVQELGEEWKRFHAARLGG